MPDVWRMLDQLSQPSFFADAPSFPSLEPVHAMAQRWHMYFSSGQFRLAMPHDAPLGASVNDLSDYWTWPDSYGLLPERAPNLHRELQASDLVIFKGDLNYRKLTQDAQWPPTTPFIRALGPLAGTTNVVALRTCKAEVCVWV